MYRNKVQFVLCFLLLSFAIISDCGETRRNNNGGDRTRREEGSSDMRSQPSRESSLDSTGGNRRNQRPNAQYSPETHQQSHTSSGISRTNHENEFGHSSNNQESSGTFGNERQGPSSGSESSLFFGSKANQNNRRPDQSWVGSPPNQFNTNEQRPGQQSFGSNSNHGNDFDYRPNQQQSGGSQFGHHGTTNQNYPSDYNSEFNQRPNQQSQFSNNYRPNEQSYNEFGQNGNQQPNQNRPSSQFNNEHFQGTTERPLLPGREPIDHINHGQSPQSVTTSQNEKETSKEKELCYGIFGCFSLLEPWSSKLRPIPGPLPPENNSMSMYFYSRPNIQQRYLVNLYPEFSLGEAKFDSRRPTAIIIHGFIQDGNELWMEEMKNAYLKQVDANVMLVDWGKGSRRLSYLQAAGNTRLIGTMVGHLIKRLMNSHGADPGNFHLIGHSLGAQIASYAGKEVPGVGRITALDPAQPGFEGFEKLVRLDKGDAQFVDVVHTNAKPFIPTLGLGMIKPYGHVDFYMNGGFDQPLCVSPPKNSIKEIKSILDLANLPVDWFSQTFFCDHARAHAYFTEALNNTDCVFWGHKATVKNVAQGVVNALTQGLLSKYVALSTTCSKEDCVPLGFLTEKSPLRGSFVVTTNGKFPYCRSEPGVPAERESKNTNTYKNNS